MTQPVLWYFADPMCSWCWGVSPVIRTLKTHYEDRCKVALILGGLRPGTREPLTDALRDEILHHWRDVQRLTGQAFQFENPMPEGFVYDTEPPSRAVISVATCNAPVTFDYFTAVQRAFYEQGRDVTDPAVLVRLASQYGVENRRFFEFFESDQIREKTIAHFQTARRFGVQGFPTLILQSQGRYHLLTRGYRPLEPLAHEIEGILEAA